MVGLEGETVIAGYAIPVLVLRGLDILETHSLRPCDVR